VNATLLDRLRTELDERRVTVGLRRGFVVSGTQGPTLGVDGAILVNLAANCARSRGPTSSPTRWPRRWPSRDRVLAVNVHGTFRCCRRALPAMRSGGWGRIVNFSSTAGRTISTAGGAHYTTAKHGVLGVRPSTSTAAT
jgi:NAD(P)-dependent dehydrogenase (short-subunit alcohol dehydrogenase family)